MIRRVVAAVAAAFAAGCAAFRPINPNPPQYEAAVYSDTVVVTTPDSINVTVWAEPEGISFHIDNRSATSATFFWNEGALVDDTGQSSPIAHVGVKFIDCERSKVPTVVPSQSRADEAIIPCNRVHFASFGAWSVDPPLLGTKRLRSASDSSSAIRELRPVVGRAIRVVLPIQSRLGKQEHTFTVRFAGVRITQMRD